MSIKSSVIVVLPAYNEAENLPVLLAQLAPLSVYTIVVDDGSTDGTWEWLSERHGEHSHSSRFNSKAICFSCLPCRMSSIRHISNQGLGATLLTGLKYANNIARSGDIIVTMDADNSHDPSLIPTMCDVISGGADIVVASRYQRGSKVVGLSPLRHLTSLGARLLFQLLLPIPGVRDYTCGYRAYRADTLRLAFNTFGDMLISHKGFSCMAEILVKMAGIGAKVAEVPMTLRYDLKRGPSKMRVWDTITSTLRLFLPDQRAL